MLLPILAGFVVAALAGIGYALSCIAEELKRANALKAAELKSVGVSVE